MNEAALYPGIGAIEGTNISVGRGTDTPFEQLGAPWIDGVQLADALNARSIPGVRFYPVRFTPDVEQVSPTRSARACSSSSPIARRCARCASGSRSPRRCIELYPVAVPAGQRGPAVRLDGRARAHRSRRRSGRDRGLVGRARKRSWRLLRAKYLLYPDGRVIGFLKRVCGRHESAGDGSCPNSPSGCSVEKQPVTGDDLRAHWGGPVRGHPRVGPLHFPTTPLALALLVGVHPLVRRLDERHDVVVCRRGTSTQPMLRPTPGGRSPLR